jgi:pimeloyl-ACP methyl ester carboxylesterase
MSEMGRERSVIAPDLPGAGMSDPLNNGADAAAQAEAMLEVVAELGLGMVDVIGIQEGGAIAVEMTHQKPEVVRKIVLIAAAAPAGLLSQPTLALDDKGFPDGNENQAAATIRAFLDT